MATKTMPSTERRKSQRRNTTSKIFVLFGRHRTNIGQVVDICQDGLCCLAMDGPRLENTEAISLVAYGEKEQFSVIKSLPLDHLQLEKSTGPSEKVLKIRLHFADLSHPQQRELAAFLRMHTGPTLTGFNMAWVA